ncbi:hypothetical protein LXL04_008662 [Taraxacum kok-saghyz]
MKSLLKTKWRNVDTLSYSLVRHYSSVPSTPPLTDLEKLCDVVTHGIGSLDDLEATLNSINVSCCSSLITQVLDSTKNEAPTRRLLRFFLWSEKHSVTRLDDKDYNHAIRVIAEKKDFLSLHMLISNLSNQNRAMETSTFCTVSSTLVQLGRVDEALGIFKNLNKLKCPQDTTTITAIVSALCSKGHVKRAEGVIHHHKHKLSTPNLKLIIYKNLLHGYSLQKNIKESRKILKDMKGAKITPDIFIYNTFLNCLCEKNLKSNPSGLVPDALNVMMEMRSYQIAPTTITYNILLSCLGRTRRVKESLQIFKSMRNTCCPDWMTYYLVARVLYLTGRFGKGKKIVDAMIEEGLVPERKFYYDLIGVLCGVERVNYAIELFDLMKGSGLGGYEKVYEMLIRKVCGNGEFEKGKELWDEAMGMGLEVECGIDVLNPLVTKVFVKSIRKVEKEGKVLEIGNEKSGVKLKKGKKLFVGKKNGKKLMVHKVKKKGTST